MSSDKRQKTMMKNGEDRLVLASLSAQQLDCDAWLGLKHSQESYPTTNGDGFGYSFSNQADYFHHHQPVDGDSLILPRSAFNYSEAEQGGMGMGGSGKSLFTGSQWEELERQRLIQKCIMASPLAVPPPQFLLPLPNNVVPSSLAHLPPPPPPPPVSQSDTNMRYAGSGSSSSDPEPWRCKRTDGKKWRCSRDAAPEQKYCERHAHKNKPRPRSRKHVEISNISHNHHNNNNPHQHQQYPILPLPNTTDAPATATAHLTPSMSPLSYGQTRSVDWFMKGSRTPVSDSPWQQVLMMTSSTLEVNRDNTDYQSKNVPFSSSAIFPTTLNNPFLTDASDNNNNKKQKQAPVSKKLSPSSSLTLSISGANPDSDIPGRWMMDSDDDDCNGILEVPPWMRTTMGMNPGGPLGEALCLGNTAATAAAKATRGGWNLASPYHQRRC